MEFDDEFVRHWSLDAACFGQPDRIFFPTTGRVGLRAAKIAKAFCRRCPVTAECLEDAMVLERASRFNRHGIRGGLSPRERSTLAGRRGEAMGTAGMTAADRD